MEKRGDGWYWGEFHGDGVKAIALEVTDVEQAWQATTQRGGKSAWGPREETDEHGTYRTAAIYKAAGAADKLVRK